MAVSWLSTTMPTTLLKVLKQNGYEFVFISDLILKENYEIKYNGYSESK